MLTSPFALYTKAYAGLSKPTWWLSLVMLVNRSGTMVVPFMTIYLTQKLHYSIVQAGYIMGLFGAGAIVGALIGGRLTDRIGFYPVQLITLLGGGCMFIVLGQMQSYLLICIFTFVLSMVNEAFRPANASAIAWYSTEANRTRSYSLNRLAINLGWAAGGALGGFIASYDYSLLFWVDGLTNILAAILLRVFLVPSQASKPQKTKVKKAGNHSAYHDKTYLFFIFLSTIFAVCFFQMFTTLPVYYKQELHLSVMAIGIIMAMNGLLIAFFEMVIVFNLEGKKRDTWYISQGVLLVGLSFVVLNLTHITAVFIASASMILITLGEMLSMPFMNSFWVTRTTAVNRGQYASLYTISYSIAHVLGPTAGSRLIALYGFNMLWWIIGLVCLINAIAFRCIKNTQTVGSLE